MLILVVFTAGVFAADQDSLNVVNKFTSKFGEGFIIYWDGVTGTYHRILGRGIRLREGGFLRSTDAVKFFESFLNENSKLFKVNLKNLKLAQIDSSKCRDWYLGYKQYYQGLSVLNSHIGVTISRDGEIISLGFNYYPDINIDPTPKVALDEALQTIKEKLRLDSINVITNLLGVFPIEGDSGYSYRLVWKIVVCGLEPMSRSRGFLVNAINGKILREFQTIFHGNWTIEGFVSGMIRPEYHNDPPEGFPLRYLDLKITLDPGVYRFFQTDMSGYYHEQGYSEQDTNLLTIYLSGYFVEEMWKRYWRWLPLPGYDWKEFKPFNTYFPSTGYTQFNYTWEEKGLEEEAVNAYYHITKMGKIIVSPPFNYPISKLRRVNVADGIYDSWYDYPLKEIYFSSENYRYALSSDACYHEYGHH